MTEMMTPWTLFQNNFVLRSARVANFAEIIEIATIFIKTTFKDSKKLKELCVKMQSISVFPQIRKIADFLWKMLMSAERKTYITWFVYFFGSSLSKV